MENDDINLTYVLGKNKVLADKFWILPHIGALGKNKENGKMITFKTLEVPIGEEDLFMHEQHGTESLQLLPTLCRNVNVDMVKLFIKLPALQEMIFPFTVQNIQMYKANDPWLIQTSLSQPSLFSIRIINM